MAPVETCLAPHGVPVNSVKRPGCKCSEFDDLLLKMCCVMAFGGIWYIATYCETLDQYVLGDQRHFTTHDAP